MLLRILTLIAAVLLISTSAFAGGLYDETQTPIDGQVISYRRMPTGTVTNPLGGTPAIEMVTEQVKLYPDGATQLSFVRRVSVGYMDFYGKKYPLFNPAIGTQIGTIDGDTLYSLLYSTWILGEKKADGKVGYSASNPTIICYTTSGTPDCVIPE